MDLELKEVIQSRERMAEAYLILSNKYNIPIDIFGGEIDFLEPELSTSPIVTVRNQVLNYLYRHRDSSKERLGWAAIYGRLPDQQLRLAIGLDLLGDHIPKSSIMPEVMWFLLSDITDCLNSNRRREEILEKWSTKLARKIVGSPLDQSITNIVKSFATKSFETPNDLGNEVDKTFNAIEMWKDNEEVSLRSRTDLMKKIHRDFDPGSQKWQEIFLSRVSNLAIDLNKVRAMPHPSTVNHGICLIGLQHGSKDNLEVIYGTLKILSKKGFTALTMEEPKDTSWKPYIEFTQCLGRRKKWKPAELLKKAKEHCLDKGVTNDSSPEKLSTIYFAKQLGFNVSFIDNPYEDKKKRAQDRKEKYLRDILDGPPLDTSDPITAVGGVGAWVNNLERTYNDCLQRSKEMAEAIYSESLKNKVVHIGGNLHLLDIKEELSLKTKSLAKCISITPPGFRSPIPSALGKLVKNCPKLLNFQIEPSANYKYLLKNALNQKEGNIALERTLSY